MAFCPKCGAQVADNAAFCANCGTQFARQAQQQVNQAQQQAYQGQQQAQQQAYQAQQQTQQQAYQTQQQAQQQAYQAQQQAYQAQQQTQQQAYQAQQQGFNAQANQYAQKIANLNNTADATATMDPNDIAQNKLMGVLAYFGILFLIPRFAAKNSRFAQYHANQGHNLAILDVAYTVLSILLRLIRTPVRVYGYTVGYATPWWITVILLLVSIPMLILFIIGIVNVVKGRAKELPVIGKFKFLKF